jgi:hypothetical protein
VRIRVLAPFDRGLSFGGSQRATAVAERLEDRHLEVSWTTVAPREGRSRLERLRAVTGPTPSLVAYHRAAEPISPEQVDADVVLVAHSYMWPSAERLTCARVADFHNLEWVQLADIAALSSGARRLHLRRQTAMVRHFERRVAAEAALSLFVTEGEREWGERHGATAPLVLANVLPRDTAADALALGATLESRSELSGAPHLSYVGQLRYPPNARALDAFVRETWPSVRAALPDATLRVAGQCPPALAASLRRAGGVDVLGYVDDLAPILAASTAALLPVRSRAGSSLRVLFHALAGIPMIGSPDAFRGFPDGMGTVARSSGDWVTAIAAHVGSSMTRQATVARARAVALAAQEDDRPWDDLVHRIASRI